MARMQGLSLAGGNRGLLIIAAIAGIAAAVLFIAAVNSGGGGSSTSATSETAPVVVAATEISVGEEIRANMVEVKSVPNELVVTGAFPAVDTAVGQRARVPVAAGEQITPAKVGAPTEGAGLGYVLPPGKVAVGVEVSEATQAGGNLLPGDHIDLLATFQPTEAGAPVVVYTFLRDLEVLSVAQEAQEAVTAAPDAPGGTDDASLTTSGEVPKDVKEQPSAVTVTVAVDPSQAQLVSCIQDHPNVSRVWLTLRAFGEPAPAEVMTVPQGYCQLNG